MELNRRQAFEMMDISSRNPLESSMLFLTGPRQVGKAYMARRIIESYYNWDTPEVKKAWLKDPYFFRNDSRWIVFDEIHKRKDWKKILKGLYDSPERMENFFVTGSGKFNLARKGGDSLQGRYELFHLFPLTMQEALGKVFKNFKAQNFAEWEPSSARHKDLLLHLYSYGGFPEPFLKANSKQLQRWNDLYIQRLVQEDTRDFSQVTQLDKLETLARLLPARVCSPISFQSLAEDVEVSRETIKSWLSLFETLYLGFLLKPYSRKIHRAVKREPKWYFFQWTMSEDEGARFENFIAVQLYTICKLYRDHGLGTYELFYIRDQDRREVDFVIVKDLKPVALFEAKRDSKSWENSIEHYSNKLNVPGFLLILDGLTRKIGPQKWLLPADQLFTSMLVPEII